MIGESTQNQDQVITLHSLRTIKAIVSNPKNPILPWISILLVIGSIILFIFLKKYKSKNEAI